MATAVWAWQDEGGHWTPYDSAQCRAIEEARQAGRRTLSLRLGRRAVTLDLTQLRPIKQERVDAQPIPPGLPLPFVTVFFA